MNFRSVIRVVTFGIVLLAYGVPALAAEKGNLRAGAARIDITPPKDARLPMRGYSGRTEGHAGVHDNLYVRVIVVDDGATRGAIIGCDLIGIGHDFWEKMTQQITGRTGIPREHILLAGTHTHGGPSPSTNTDADTDDSSGRHASYVTELEQKIIEAVERAQANLQPARAGFATGQASVNMNRRARMADGGWWLGSNPNGPSDKTVAVVKFESLSGEPLAVFINYGVHGTVLGPNNDLITGDLPGATSRHVEEHYGGKVVALWTSGTAGDQDPLYRVGTDFEQMAILGRILGEEVIRVTENIKTSTRSRIRGAQKVVTCPGRKLPPGPRRRRDQNYRFLDADPVPIRLSVLMINHIALVGVSGEVLTMIGQRLKQESPFSQTIMMTHCNGSSGYLPDDAAYDQISYEIAVSRVKRGCAEDAIVNGLLDLMDRF